MHDETPTRATTTKGDVPAEIPANWRAPAHAYPISRCEHCGHRRSPWGTVLIAGREFVVLHCGDHPLLDRLWNETTGEDCGPLHETRR